MAVVNSQRIGDYMVRNPVCAHEWQPISFIRQIMLENSFSHIPFYREEQKEWHVISDLDVAKIRQKEKLDTGEAADGYSQVLDKAAKNNPSKGKSRFTR